MSNGKYGNLLTGLLVLAIIGVIGLLVFLGIDLFNKFNLDKEQIKGVEQFDSQVPDIEEPELPEYSYIEETPSSNTSAANIVNPFDNMEKPATTAGPKATSNKKGVTYEHNGKKYLQVGTISIPKTGLNCAILDNAGKNELEIAVGVMYGVGLNQVGNTVIAGHNYRNGTLFSKNKNIQVNDKINIKDINGRTVTYTVYNIFETQQEDTSYFNKDTEGKREITLYTCNDDSSRRLIIEARAD